MIKSQDELTEAGCRQSDVLIAALEKCRELEQTVQGLEAELSEVISVLLKVSPEHERWIKMNFSKYFKEANND